MLQHARSYSRGRSVVLSRALSKSCKRNGPQNTLFRTSPHNTNRDLLERNTMYDKRNIKEQYQEKTNATSLRHPPTRHEKNLTKTTARGGLGILSSQDMYLQRFTDPSIKVPEGGIMRRSRTNSEATPYKLCLEPSSEETQS